MIMWENVVLKISTLDVPFSQVKQNSFSIFFFIFFLVSASRPIALKELPSWACGASQKDLNVWFKSLYQFSQNKRTPI